MHVPVLSGHCACISGICASHFDEDKDNSVVRCDAVYSAIPFLSLLFIRSIVPLSFFPFYRSH
jgi:hypothetical protein